MTRSSSRSAVDRERPAAHRLMSTSLTPSARSLPGPGSPRHGHDGQGQHHGDQAAARKTRCSAGPSAATGISAAVDEAWPPSRLAQRGVGDGAEDGDAERAAHRAGEHVGAGDHAALGPSRPTTAPRSGSGWRAAPCRGRSRSRSARPARPNWSGESSGQQHRADRRSPPIRSAPWCGSRSAGRSGRPARRRSASPGSAPPARSRRPARWCRARPGRRAARRR